MFLFYKFEGLVSTESNNTQNIFAVKHFPFSYFCEHESIGKEKHWSTHKSHYVLLWEHSHTLDHEG